MAATLHPISTPTPNPVTRPLREKRNSQKAKVIWLYGLSGAGKSTLAQALDERLYSRGYASYVLDGDIIRTGLCKGLGFSPEDRSENLRRSAEVARLFADAGLIVLCAFITPTRHLRAMIRDIIGADLIEVFVDASFETCSHRDTKGLYKRAAQGQISQFTGSTAPFERPSAPDIVINTEVQDLAASLEILLSRVLPLISPVGPSP